MSPAIDVGGRRIGPEHPPLVVAEIGINHEGDMARAIRMIDDARGAGCECVKFQSHVVEDEMVPNDVVPANAGESIWEIMRRAALTEEQERELKAYVESRGMVYLCTPFSRAAAERLRRMEVECYKVGSGECNNLPLVRHIASLGRPVILSTGMNDLGSVGRSVNILRAARVPFALLHCTSIYPTPYEKVRLGAIPRLARAYPDAVIGLSDHSPGIYTCLGAVALGAAILEKHFTSDKRWPGPDIPLSLDPAELRELIAGARAVWEARGTGKEFLDEERSTAAFAFASVVAIRDIRPGERLSAENIWVKRPGTGEIPAAEYESLLGRSALRPIRKDAQLRWSDLSPSASSLSPGPAPTMASCGR